MRYLYILLIVAVAGASCKKTLEEHPESIAAENFYKKPAEVEAGLNAIYTPLRDGGGLGALYQTQLECYADYFYGRGSHAVLNTYSGLDNTNISRVAGMWNLFYLSIRNANIMVQKIPLASAVGDADKARYLAEARFLRALNYFYLVRNWAGVPIRTEANMDSINVKRSAAGGCVCAGRERSVVCRVESAGCGQAGGGSFEVVGQNGAGGGLFVAGPV
ncbi:RagB/SusD family nutrient uptake outer membrane protein [Puia sp. P3]|uniref:RagB/SusD family nutrient uptake outer membrane protein n=1 Tax=Puia sp. P3 TaxID=3423952 RepID=UPI003D67B822